MDDYPDEWNTTEVSLWENLIEATGQSGLRDDWQAQALYDTALFAEGLTEGQREQALEWLEEYLSDVYDFDFDEFFDWEGFREWYG